MNMSKREKSVCAIFAIVFVLFTGLFLVLPFKKSAASWIEYGFALPALGIGLLITFYAFRNKKTLQSKLYGFPVFKVGIMYTAIQLAVSVLFWLIGIFVDISPWIALIVSLLILGVAAIGLIAVDNARDAIEQVEQNVIVKTRNITYFRVDTQSVINSCKDAKLKSELVRFAEDIRYSDPVSSPETTEAEAAIKAGMDEMRDLLIQENYTAAEAVLTKLSGKLEERNQICKLYKR